MHIQEYISSGIIEDYCLGLLEPKAREEVAEYALRYEAVRIAIESCEYALKRFVEDTGGKFTESPEQKENLFKLLKTNQKDNF